MRTDENKEIRRQVTVVLLERRRFAINGRNTFHGGDWRGKQRGREEVAKLRYDSAEKSGALA